MADIFFTLIAVVTIMIFMLFLFLALKPRRNAVVVNAPRVAFRAVLQDNTGIHEVKSAEPLDNELQRWIMKYSDGGEKCVYSWEVHPAHPIMTMLSQNTEGGRAMWLWGPSKRGGEPDAVRGEAPEIPSREEANRKRPSLVAQPR